MRRHSWINDRHRDQKLVQLVAIAIDIGMTLQMSPGDAQHIVPYYVDRMAFEHVESSAFIELMLEPLSGGD